MRARHPVVLAAVVLAAGAGCGDDGSSSDREERSRQAVSECRGHGGVSAFDDDIVICRDQSFHEAEEG